MPIAANLSLEVCDSSSHPRITSSRSSPKDAPCCALSFSLFSIYCCSVVMPMFASLTFCSSVNSSQLFNVVPCSLKNASTVSVSSACQLFASMSFIEYQPLITSPLSVMNPSFVAKPASMNVFCSSSGKESQSSALSNNSSVRYLLLSVASVSITLEVSTIVYSPAVVTSAPISFKKAFKSGVMSDVAHAVTASLQSSLTLLSAR